MIDNVSFQGKSFFMGNKGLFNGLERTLPKKAHINDSSVHYLQPNSSYISNAHRTSFLVIVSNGISGIAKRISLNNIERSVDTIATETRKLSETVRPKNKKLTAWIIGGGNIENPERGADTVNTMNGIAKAIEDNSKVDLSILAGDSEGYKEVFFSTNNGNIQIVLNEDINRACWRQKIDGMFDIVELSKVSRMGR